jgi:DNA-binding transcriptional MocR family regulator
MGEGASLSTVWRHAIADADLTPTQKLVALMISAHMNGTGEAWPSVETLVDETGLTRSTVQRARAALATSGLLVFDQGGGRSRTNRYMAAIPPHQRGRLEEKGHHQRTERAAGEYRNSRTGAARSTQEVTKEGASPGFSDEQEADTEHHEGNPWCLCPDCRKREEHEPHREQRNREATPARVAIPAEEVALER